MPPPGPPHPTFAARPPDRSPRPPGPTASARGSARPSHAQAAARATNVASALQEKARLYAGPGSFFSRLSQQVSEVSSAVASELTGAPAAEAAPRRPSTPTELRVD